MQGADQGSERQQCGCKSCGDRANPQTNVTVIAIGDPADVGLDANGKVGERAVEALDEREARLAGGLSVTEEEVKRAVRFAFETLKLVVEPGGAVALAAILAGKIDCNGKTVAATLSGGNADAELIAGILGSA